MRLIEQPKLKNVFVVRFDGYYGDGDKNITEEKTFDIALPSLVIDYVRCLNCISEFNYKLEGKSTDYISLFVKDKIGLIIDEDDIFYDGDYEQFPYEDSITITKYDENGLAMNMVIEE